LRIRLDRADRNPGCEIFQTTGVVFIQMRKQNRIDVIDTITRKTLKPSLGAKRTCAPHIDHFNSSRLLNQHRIPLADIELYQYFVSKPDHTRKTEKREEKKCNLPSALNSMKKNRDDTRKNERGRHRRGRNTRKGKPLIGNGDSGSN